MVDKETVFNERKDSLWEKDEICHICENKFDKTKFTFRHHW